MRTECQRIIVLAVFFILALVVAGLVGLYPAGPEANAGILAPPTTPATPAPRVVTLYPAADTFVDEANPNQNYSQVHTASGPVEGPAGQGVSQQVSGETISQSQPTGWGVAVGASSQSGHAVTEGKL